MKRSIIWILVMTGLLAVPATSLAHGTDYRVTEDSRVVAAEFFYSDQSPMRYAEVLIFSPENDEVEFQNGRTDRNGRFAFCPKKPGKWHVKVNDGMGHAVDAVIEVPASNAQKDAADNASENERTIVGGASKFMKIGLGLSLLINIFLGMYVWQYRREA
ncbi:MAG: hypothetical protein ACQERN_12280 [Thermodesulfobacteriota bacterium]